MQEWSTRWYTPLVAVGFGLAALLTIAVAGVEVLTAPAPPAVAPPAWPVTLARLDEALARGDRAEALSWWREAHAAALRSRQWEGMIEVGDAARRFDAGAPRARQAYLTAFARARQQRSLDGVLRVAVAFGELGDRDVLVQALRVARREAGLDPGASARVQAIAERWPSPPLIPERAESRYPGGNLP